MEPSHYELVQVLGEGGMGRVYRAVHWPSATAVAIKTLRSEVRSDAVRRRFLLDEATAAAKLDDPRIVRLLDVGRDDEDTPFLVMELASGRGLDHWLDAWPGWRVMLRALLDVLDGLSAAHAAGIVHCDLKPANVMLDPEAGARILDFGVAALLDPLRGELADGVRGTPEFMPPEQLSSVGPLGPWTDLYAFGILLAHAVRDASPFEGIESLAQLYNAKLQYAGERPPPVRAGLEVPPELQALIERLLAPRPRGRPRFAVDVRRELAELGARVIDRNDTGDPEEEDRMSGRPTSVDGFGSFDSRSGGSDRDPQRTLPPRLEHVLSRDASRELVLPARLPAPIDIAGGVALARLRELPIVGRARERAELEELVGRVAREGGAHLLAYAGEAGIGKSRLARWGLGMVEQVGAMEGAAGGYDPSGADVAGGLRHALRRLVGEPARNYEQTWDWLAGEPGLDLALLARFLRADETLSTLGVDTVARLGHATLRAISRVRPVYLWLDNLAWARDGALEMVEALLEANDVPILIVATMRGGTLKHARVKQRFERLLENPRAHLRRIGPLGKDERASLARAVAPLAPAVATALAEQTDGSPLLLVQLVHDWLLGGLLEPSAAGLVPAGQKSVQALLAERPMAALVHERVRELLSEFGAEAPNAEAVLGRAALLGARFEHSALRAACARRPKLTAAIDRVLDRALLVGVLRSEQGRVYAFDNGLVHEAFVERIEAGAERSRALVDAANGLQARYGKERADIAALVADLLKRAGDTERAWERLLRAIARSAWANDEAAARAHLATAREWLTADPSRAAQVELADARMHYFLLRYEEALAAIARARAAARAGAAAPESQDEWLMMRCDAVEADVLFYLDRFAESQHLAKRCATAGSDDDPEQAAVRAQALQRLGELAAVRGDLESALEWRRRAWLSAQAMGSSARTRITRLNLAEVLSVLGRTDEALVLLDSVEEEARAERDDEHVQAARDDRAQALLLAGDAGAALARLDERAIALELSSDPWRFTKAAALRALAAAELDEPQMERWVRAFAAAFRAVPNDEVGTTAAMRRLAGRLEDYGRFELAHEIDGLLQARQDRYDAGFSRASDPDLKPGR